MVDTPTTRLLLREQSLGSNTNTWGDTKLNQALETIDRSMVGYQAYTVTGDATLSWTNYSTSNDFSVFSVKLTGAPSAACTITVNSTQMRWKVWNDTGVTVTIKTAAGTGVAIPDDAIVDIICDATNVVLLTAQYGGKASPANSLDIPSWGAVQTAIATAVIPAAAGTVLVSGADTTAGYVSAKISASSANHSWAISGGGGDEDFQSTVRTMAFISGGTISGAQSVAVGTEYLADFTASSYTITGPAAPTAGDKIKICKYGTNVMTFGLNSLKFNGLTANPVTTKEGTTVLEYTGASRGWVEL